MFDRVLNTPSPTKYDVMKGRARDLTWKKKDDKKAKKVKGGIMTSVYDSIFKYLSDLRPSWDWILEKCQTRFSISYLKVYSEPCLTSKMERFAKLVNGLKPTTKKMKFSVKDFFIFCAVPFTIFASCPV